MKAHLLYRDRDFDLEGGLPVSHEALTRDLELTVLFDAMAAGDAFLHGVVRRVILVGLSRPDEIAYRQDVVRDCLDNRVVVRQIYDLAVEAIERERRHWSFGRDYPSGRLQRAVDVLKTFVAMLRRLRLIAETHSGTFSSDGFTTFFAMLRSELGDDFFDAVEDHLKRLRFRRGVLISGRLGTGLKGESYVLRNPGANEPSWLARLIGAGPPEFTYTLPARDEAGGRAMAELRDRGIALVASAAAQSSDHILDFFKVLRVELAFYLGCINLHEGMSGRDAPLCFPTPRPTTERAFAGVGLYDISLALTLDRKIVGSDVAAPAVRLVFITGANQGGKSTFLRSAGLAQLMMQAGMFVPAEAFSANVCDGLFTHFKREEDTSMRSGKLDEELARMSAIVDGVRPDSIILFNESFAATNEREGSEIARQIVTALIERGVKILFVTHMYDLAHGFYDRRTDDMLFLRAERRPDGTRTFRQVVGEPLDTSYGPDLYERVFNAAAEAPAAMRPAEPEAADVA